MLKVFVFGEVAYAATSRLADRLDRLEIPCDCVYHAGRLAGLLDVAFPRGQRPGLPLLVLAGVCEDDLAGRLADVSALGVLVFETRDNARRLNKVVQALCIASNWQVVPLPLVVGVAGSGLDEFVGLLVSMRSEIDRTRAWRWSHRC